jgi:membrane protease YdiL (CAAX protease family)
MTSARTSLFSIRSHRALAVAGLPIGALALMAAAGRVEPSVSRVLLLLVVAPLLEEIVFRAGVHEMLCRRLGGWGSTLAVRTSNLLTALIFAAAHLAMHVELMAALTVLPALALGWIYQQQRRLAPCVAAHALLNAVWLLTA